MSSITASVAFWLGVYATGLSSLVAVLALSAEVLQRVRVKAEERFYVKHFGGGGMAIRDAETLKAMNVPQNSARPVLTLTVMNRGRRPVRIDAIAKARFGASHHV